MSRRRIAVYGAGGFAREVAWLVESCRDDRCRYEPACFIDDDESRKKIYSNLLQKSMSISVGDLLEQPDAVEHLRKALVRAFPTIFSSVARKRHIAKRTGLNLLDEEDVKQAIHAMKAKSKRITPETRKARRFLMEQLIARGYKREEIAAMLGVSVKTVYNTLKSQK